MIRKKWIRIELWTGHLGLYSDNFPSEFNYREMNNSAKKKEREKKKIFSHGLCYLIYYY